jgi:hypothetical protein
MNKNANCLFKIYDFEINCHCSNKCKNHYYFSFLEADLKKFEFNFLQFPEFLKFAKEKHDNPQDSAQWLATSSVLTLRNHLITISPQYMT